MLVEIRGTLRALPLDMDSEAIELMNFEQLATATDRLLLRARFTSRRLSSNKLAFAGDRVTAKRISSLTIAPLPEHTMFIRAKKFSTSTTSAALLATLFAIAILITSVV